MTSVSLAEPAHRTKEDRLPVLTCFFFLSVHVRPAADVHDPGMERYYRKITDGGSGFTFEVRSSAPRPPATVSEPRATE